MTSLKLGRLEAERPIKITVELPATLHRELVRYGEVLARETGEQVPIELTRLVGPMLARFMSTDRGFMRSGRRSSASS